MEISESKPSNFSSLDARVLQVIQKYFDKTGVELASFTPLLEMKSNDSDVWGLLCGKTGSEKFNIFIIQKLFAFENEPTLEIAAQLLSTRMDENPKLLKSPGKSDLDAEWLQMDDGLFVVKSFLLPRQDESELKPKMKKLIINSKEEITEFTHTMSDLINTIEEKSKNEPFFQREKTIKDILRNFQLPPLDTHDIWSDIFSMDHMEGLAAAVNQGNGRMRILVRVPIDRYKDTKESFLTFLFTYRMAKPIFERAFEKSTFTVKEQVAYVDLCKEVPEKSINFKMKFLTPIIKNAEPPAQYMIALLRLADGRLEERDIHALFPNSEELNAFHEGLKQFIASVSDEDWERGVIG